jgi:hypothetical protein
VTYSDKLMTVTVDGVELKSTPSFWRGEHTNFRPVAQGMNAPDDLVRYVLSGWMPDAPFIERDTTVVAFGSCFAKHISGYLNNLGFDVSSRNGKAYISEMAMASSTPSRSASNSTGRGTAVFPSCLFGTATRRKSSATTRTYG